jgi:hypothetical protein
MTNQKIEYWVIPPEANAEFVANMENVLETYEKPYDSSRPVICMDEQPVQLVKETRSEIPATKNHPRRVDYEYERNGTASIFMFCEPLAGWRQATAREQRTKFDWAQEVASLLDGKYANCDRITLVCDNLNTHCWRVLRSVSTGASASVRSSDRLLFHTKTWQLVEYRGK